MAIENRIGIELRAKGPVTGLIRRINKGDEVDSEEFIFNHIAVPRSFKVYNDSKGVVTPLDHRRPDGDRVIYEGRVLLVDAEEEPFELRAWRNKYSSRAEQERTPLSRSEFGQRLTRTQSKYNYGFVDVEAKAVEESVESEKTPNPVVGDVERRFQIAQGYRDRLEQTSSGLLLVVRNALANEFDQKRIKGKNSKDMEGILSASGIKVIPDLHNGPQHVLLASKDRGLYKEHPELFGDDPYQSLQNALEFSLGKVA